MGFGDGTWRNGEWIKGMWEDGGEMVWIMVWENGKCYNMHWWNGTWEDGLNLELGKMVYG